MTIILLLGIICMFFLLVNKPHISVFLSEKIILGKILEKSKWFQNYKYAGIFLFIMNAFLFSCTIVILYLLMKLSIPFLHLIVMCAAVIISVIVWFSVCQAWNGSKKQQLMVGFVGSSFYLILTIIFVYWLVTLKPSHPDEDMFMAMIGLFFASIVTSVAFLVCFIITGFPIDKVFSDRSSRIES
ncbi:hypothetical protein [Bacillus solimangrovi]|uniref:Transmembrane protein n=1 Tax=Bacillus solimangrovi TaxID=1305675 RepID=A0A1E5LK19_9BACI|nr:hypothetical protein [Bacillus solimangrovi]OEH94449.1 hypothetical protein BFG57_08290 [Bacillus solimangrovi]